MDRLTVQLPAGRFTIMDSPDPLYNDECERVMSLPDEAQRVIWIDPDVRPEDRPQLHLDVVSYLWIRQLNQIPVAVPLVC